MCVLAKSDDPDESYIMQHFRVYNVCYDKNELQREKSNIV